VKTYAGLQRLEDSHSGVADVASIEEAEQIQCEHDGDDSKIEASSDLPLLVSCPGRFRLAKCLDVDTEVFLLHIHHG
jgi:hypothetical protein